MTPKKRAEKIFSLLATYTPVLEIFETKTGEAIALEKIAVQIEEAEREAVHKAIVGSFTKEYQAKFDEGFHVAQEKAARLAEDFEAVNSGQYGREIAGYIRELKP